MDHLSRRMSMVTRSRLTPQAALAHDERRFAPRRPGTTPAMIYFDGATESIPCLIKDMSTTGARLELRSGWDNPFKVDASQMDKIKLVARLDKVMYECRIMRRGEAELGVRFTSAPKPLTRVVR